MSQSFTINGLLAVALFASAACAATQPRELMLFDFETNDGGLNLGGEFPGAEGQFAVTAAAAHDGKHGGRLSFDLTKGAYVAWGLDLSTPLVVGAQSLSVWVRTDAAGRRVHCKTRDATGQEHMRTSAVLPVGPTSMRLAELTGPASRIRPAIFTPSTSATEMAGWPLVGTSEGTPRPRRMVSGLVTFSVSSSA